MFGNHQIQMQIIWQDFLIVLQNIFINTQDFIIENNNNLELHKQMMILNDWYIEAREMRSTIVDKAIDEGDIDKMFSEVVKAERELKKFVSLSISMQAYVYVEFSNLVSLC